MRVPLRPAAFAVAAMATLALTAPALGHETVTDRGVAVTLHVLPDDEHVVPQCVHAPHVLCCRLADLQHHAPLPDAGAAGLVTFLVCSGSSGCS